MNELNIKNIESKLVDLKAAANILRTSITSIDKNEDIMRNDMLLRTHLRSLDISSSQMLDLCSVIGNQLSFFKNEFNHFNYREKLKPKGK